MKTYQLETKKGNLHVRTRTTVIRNGKVITSTLHRHVIAPGQDYSKDPGKVRRAAKKLHTPARIKAYKAEQKAREDDTFKKPKRDVSRTDVIIREDDTIEVCKCTEIYENGKYHPQHHPRIKVEPGTPVLNAPAIVTDMIAAAHVPTVVARHKKTEAYREAKQAREQDDTPANRKAELAAKAARDKARKDHDDFVKAES